MAPDPNGSRGSPESSAAGWRRKGNAYLQKDKTEKAIQAFQSGLACLDDTNPNHLDLQISLRTLLAQTCRLQKDYSFANAEYTWILERQPNNGPVLWYRALSREGMAQTTSTNSPRRGQLFSLALQDIRQYLELPDAKRTEPVKAALARLETICRDLPAVPTSSSQPLTPIKSSRSTTRDRDSFASTDTTTTSSSSKGGTPSRKPQSYSTSSSSPSSLPRNKALSPSKSSSTTHRMKYPISKSPIPATEQRQNVNRLLLARHMAGNSFQGEAFFLVNWQWWTRWCHHVDFFYQSTTNQSARSSASSQSKHCKQVLQMLPPGAVVPDFDELKQDSNTIQELGPIDNSTLLFQRSLYHLQWYQGHDRPDALRSDLVRGYHFEILPREVYSALRTWYGEVTPSLCRRANSKGIVYVYRPPMVSSSRTMDGKEHRCSACGAPGAQSHCKECLSVQYCDRQCQQSHWPYHQLVCQQAAAAANGSKVITPINRLSGRVGLNNLGNTCFMNSALQALSHSAPLTRHFLSNHFTDDVNTSNPLGTGGKLAYAYDALLKELWMRTKGKSMSPTNLKRAVALFAPRFAGCLQHDAQEFLAYLLDGLHEDLNRIRKAPYVEMPDVEEGQNMAIAGATAWDAYKRRNDSLLLDTFYGQYQSTCVCPDCERVSVSFDAFNHVSLEIPQPQKATISISVLVFRKASSGMLIPCRYGLSLRRQSIIVDLKQEVATMIGVPPNNLTMADLYGHTIYELLKDSKPLASFRPSDNIAAFEVDPISENQIPVIATHSLLMKDKTGKLQFRPFGFPVVTSFPMNMTCRQIWEQIWEAVGHFVPEYNKATGSVDAEKAYRREDILRVRAITFDFHPRPIFPTDEGTGTPILPIDADEEIGDLLGAESKGHYFFLALEWRRPKANPQENSEATSTTEGNDIIQPEAFMAHKDHVSFTEMKRQQEAENSTNKGVSLEQCFQLFTKSERLDEHNQWYCSRCKDHVRALKTMKLCRLPNILAVHLKRFEFKNGLRRDKLDTLVRFPLEGLDMQRQCTTLGGARTESPDMVDTTVDAVYDCFAVINHYGRMGFGHYTACCRQWDETGISPHWYLFDDSTVQRIDASEVVGASAYVLFYRRRQFH
eukprot:Nitzschia sp. Nitz4//scaffold244_size29068//12369//15815//NITZ4_008065-RA/size29068-snap-gene-0.6-mRNA-1//-1//CDS//3329543859//7451//frame0